MDSEITIGKLVSLVSALSDSGPAGPKGEPGLGLDDATAMQLGAGTHTVTIDNDTDVKISNITIITADGGHYNLTTTTTLPIITGNGITFETSEDGHKLIISQDLLIKGGSAPSTSTQGFIGQLFLDIISSEMYQCVDVTEEEGHYVYTWKIMGNYSEIIDIGRSQTIIDSVVYPTLTVAQATTIYEKYIAGNDIRIKWSAVQGMPIYFDIVFAKPNEYKMTAIIHDNVINYHWTGSESATSSIMPTLATTKKYIHYINIEAPTGQGVWRYQFSFVNNVSTAYTKLGQAGAYLYTNRRDIRLPASGTYLEGNDKYFVTAVVGAPNNMVAIELYRNTDMFYRTITSGLIDILDYVKEF